MVHLRPFPGSPPAPLGTDPRIISCVRPKVVGPHMHQGNPVANCLLCLCSFGPSPAVPTASPTAIGNVCISPPCAMPSLQPVVPCVPAALYERPGPLVWRCQPEGLLPLQGPMMYSPTGAAESSEKKTGGGGGCLVASCRNQACLDHVLGHYTNAVQWRALPRSAIARGMTGEGRGGRTGPWA